MALFSPCFHKIRNNLNTIDQRPGVLTVFKGREIICPDGVHTVGSIHNNVKEITSSILKILIEEE